MVRERMEGGGPVNVTSASTSAWVNWRKPRGIRRAVSASSSLYRLHSTASPHCLPRLARCSGPRDGNDALRTSR